MMTLKSSFHRKYYNKIKAVKGTLKRFMSRIKMWTGYTRFWVAVSLILGVVGLASLPKPNVLVAASIQTETLEITVSHPDSAAIMLPIGEFEIEDNVTCFQDLVLSPHQDTRVYYSRTDSVLSIVIDGPFNWISGDGVSGSERFGIVTVSDKNTNCEASSSIRLPVSGLMNIGTVAGVSSGDDQTPLVILDGNLDIYGRAADRIFWVPVSVFSLFLPMEPDRLYLADQIKVPAGSNLASESAYWGGFVDILWGNSERGLLLEASTNARTLQLQAPAPRVSSNNNILENQKADVISLTFGARLNNDPNIRWVFATVSFLCLILGVFFQLPSTKD